MNFSTVARYPTVGTGHEDFRFFSCVDPPERDRFGPEIFVPLR